MKKNNLFTPAFLILILLFPLIMIPLSFVDYEWTMFIYENRNEVFGEFMRRTLFEGDAFGASDPGIIFFMLMVTGYFVSCGKKVSGWRLGLRPQFGFAVFSALIGALGLVHSLKWIVGRARPNLVLKGKQPFTDWYEWGSQFVSDGIFFGSFPSGHTGSAFMLITFSYILVANINFSLKYRVAGWIWGVFSLVFAVGMGIGRSMTLHHWVTDCVGVILMAWAATHYIYFHGLKIPLQIQYINDHGHYPPISRCWELGLLWRLVMIILGVMGTIFGIRAVFLERAPNLLLLLLIPSLPAIYFFGKQLTRRYQEVMVHFSE